MVRMPWPVPTLRRTSCLDWALCGSAARSLIRFGDDGHDASRRRLLVADFYRRERPAWRQAALRMDCHESARGRPGRRDRDARYDGLWRAQPHAHLQDRAAVAGLADHY